MTKFCLLELSGTLASYSSQSSGPKKETVMFPGFSQISGFISNAMGYIYQDYDERGFIQDNLRFISFMKKDVKPNRILRDYQTVKRNTETILYSKKTGSFRSVKANNNAILLNKYYIQNSSVFVLFTVDGFDMEDIIDHFIKPARPLYIGRKCCVPDKKFLVNSIEFDNFDFALEFILDYDSEYSAEWPLGLIGMDNISSIARSCSIFDKNDIRDIYEDTMGGTRKVVNGILRKDVPHVHDSN